MQSLDKDTIEFLKSYNYTVKVKNQVITVMDKNYSTVWQNVIMIIIGLTGFPIAFVGNYEIGILFILFLLIPIVRMIKNKPKKVTFELVANRINGIYLSEIKEFRYSQEETYAYATPFEKGTKEYTLDLEMVNKNGIPTKIMSFIDREEEKPGAQALLKMMNGWLK